MHGKNWRQAHSLLPEDKIKSACTNPEIEPLQSKLYPLQKSRSRHQLHLCAACVAGLCADCHMFFKLSVSEASLVVGGWWVGVEPGWGCAWKQSSLNLTTCNRDRASARWFSFPGTWNRMLWFRKVKTSPLKACIICLSFDDCLLIISTSTSLSVKNIYIHKLGLSPDVDGQEDWVELS